MEFAPQTVARYQRQLSLRGFGRDAQQKLAGSHVVVVGAGGLGSPVLLYLAAAGVGSLTVELTPADHSHHRDNRDSKSRFGAASYPRAESGDCRRRHQRRS